MMPEAAHGSIPLTVSLQVPDVAAAVRFYVEVLAFEQTGSWADGGEPIWAEVSRPGPNGVARIWFFSHPLPGMPKATFSGVIYLFVGDVQTEADRLRGTVPFRWGPELMPYGLRELGIEDLNGYLVCFAEDA